MPSQIGLFGPQIIKSIHFSNHSAISGIMDLYDIDRFCLDCTYSKGVFWQKLPQPLHKTDLYPKTNNVVKADASNLPFGDEMLSNIMFDPPFIIGGKNYNNVSPNSCVMAKRFESFVSFEELKTMYSGAIKECYRILKPGGYLVVKCQDVVADGKNHFIHCWIMATALDIGFHAKDLFLLVNKNRINSFSDKKWKKQRHARKYHSYFWVFEKNKSKIKY